MDKIFLDKIDQEDWNAINSIFATGFFPTQYTANLAARLGRVKALQVMYENEYPHPDEEGLYSAMLNGHDNVIDWMGYLGLLSKLQKTPAYQPPIGKTCKRKRN